MREKENDRRAMSPEKNGKNWSRLVLEAAQVGIFVVDPATRNIVDANPAAARRVGVSVADMVGKQCHQFVCPAQANKCPVCDLGKILDCSERILLTALGESVPILKSVEAVVIDGRTFLVETFVEITRQKQAEADLKRKMEELQAAKKVAEQQAEELKRQSVELRRARDAADESNRLKSEFLANMSHEIRTPINGILGMHTLMLLGELSPQQREYLETAQGCTESLLTLLTDILDLSKIEAGKMELSPTEVSLPLLLQDAANTMGATAKQKGLQLKLNCPGSLPEMVSCDSLRLRQVLLNLIGNAVKFTSAGDVSVAVWPETMDQKTALIHFAVSDTGVGIAENHLETIFKPFRQADGSITRNYGGTGLGLAISTRLVEMMGGRIWAESQLNVGSTFHFTARLGVPSHGPRASVVDSETKPSDARPGGRILLVEDNLINRKVAVSLLQKRGWQVVAATNGREAVEMYAQQTFDLILMDIQMPEMDGLTATQIIRQAEAGRCHTPIWAMTAHAMKEDRELCLNAGMDDFITKPVRPDHLFHMLDMLLAKKNSSQDAEHKGF